MSVARVLFLCTHNSARSQMAEGFLRRLGADRFEVASAGTQARGVNPLAARAMAEIGIDLHGHTSKTLDRFLGERWDYVITVCDSANEACPVVPNAATRLHWSFDDPSAATGSAGHRLEVFRRVRKFDASKREMVDFYREFHSGRNELPQLIAVLFHPLGRTEQALLLPAPQRKANRAVHL